MLGLKLPTDPRWADLAQMSLEAILTDHAYCELKAATTCISLIQQFPDKVRMVEEVSPVVTEEWGHFRLVIQELQSRGLQLGYQRKDEYVNRISQFVIKGGSRENRFIDRLLLCGLIEARSCERFRLLSVELEDKDLREFYHKFMVSEAGHYRMFLDLAKHYGIEDQVVNRWQDFLNYEKKVMIDLEVRGDRIH
ncbi:tRNA-(ms[2]io[6]A)-hydroxylase [Membranihabitans marinus]|uniref:tRNA-(ms[2]io[6]A)-hydroxylase n=1 Tax=Membranihabitans marinus TaxID=1227546 RepID=UPI001F3033F8|nr:tRNA-(ms[2]io[6]A)-hydroxylase [Membranihabitans marinus]